MERLERFELLELFKASESFTLSLLAFKKRGGLR